MEDYKKIKDMIDKKKKEGAFVFLPSPILPMDKSFYMPLFETVRLRDDEIYKAQGQFRIHYNGLLRLSGAAKMKWSVDDTCRMDDRSDKLYCSFRAVGGVVESDGDIQFHKAEKDIDIELIEMELVDQYTNTWSKVKDCSGNTAWKKQGHKKEETFVAAMVRRDVIQARKNKLMNAESGAKARLIRGVLGLQGSYANENQLIGMPFVMVYFVKNPGHPDVKKFLAASLANSQNQIYGTKRDQVQVPFYDKDVIDMEPVDEDGDGDSQERGDETEANKFEPSEQSGVVDGNLIDFQNSSASDQAKVLKQMCDDCSQDYSHYEKQTKGGMKNENQQWRDDFFVFLNEERKNKK